LAGRSRGGAAISGSGNGVAWISDRDAIGDRIVERSQVFSTRVDDRRVQLGRLVTQQNKE
jgi:hypothetical protein